MSELVISPDGASDSAFKATTVATIIVVGALAFIAMLVLGAYAPDLRSGRNGGSHALSNAATGFSGLVRLAEATHRNPMVVRAVHELENEDLAVITPESGFVNLNDILKARGARITLIVLPKWETVPDESNAGWVKINGLVSSIDPESVLSPSTKLKVVRAKGHGERLVNVGPAEFATMNFLAPGVVQSIRGDTIQPLITTPGGAIVLARMGSRNIYVLSDPDLLNNHGMGDIRQARAALSLLDFLNSTGATSVLFDVTANGLGRSRSPLKLAFDAPFLAVTLTIFAAMLLAAWQALARFGPVHRRERALAFGKAALVDNSAALIRKAGRETHLGSRYVEVITERASNLFHFPPTLDADELRTRLEALNPHRSFALAAEAATNVRTRDELLSATRSLNQWLEEAQR